MKKLVVLIAILVFGSAKFVAAQTFPYDTTQKKIIYSEVVQAPGNTKDVLFDRALRVLKGMYQQVDSKLAVKDKENGKIVLNGFVRIIFHEKNGLNTTYPDLVKYRFTILFKDGKYKYEITDFIVDHAGVPFHVEKWYEHNKPGDKTFTKEDRLPEKLEFIQQDIEKNIKKFKDGMVSDKVEQKKDW
jgi:hypothetical protein